MPTGAGCPYEKQDPKTIRTPMHALLVYPCLYIYILPLNKFLIISRPVIYVVHQILGKSSVEVNVSAYPIGSINGIHPGHQLCEHPSIYTLTPSILQGPGFRDHSVLLCDSPPHMVNIPRIVNLPRQCSCFVCGLLSREDVEVIISRMSSGMTFGADG